MAEAARGYAPPGWSRNPSRWSRRIPLVSSAVVGCAIALYLGMVEVGAISHAWEPFFGDGTARVLHSALARSLPVPDALLGAAGYLVEAVLGSIGGAARWQTRPWAALGFAIMAVGMGVASCGLLVVQGVLGAWCTLCIVSALISIHLVAPAVDEGRATLQRLRRERSAGEPFWRALRGESG